MSINYELIQQQARCNWCRNVMVMSEPVTQANFVDTGKKYPALYCSSCLAIEFRVKQPKTCINPDTLDEINIEDLPADADAAATANENNKEKEEKSEIAESDKT
jgi:hypothetical protein